MDLFLERLSLELAKPIHVSAPAGEDIRLDDRFEALQCQIKTVDALTVGINPDWDQIGGMARTILQEQSKDLLVMAYLCLAWAHLHRAQGIAVGLSATVELLEKFGEQLFPRKPRARQYALDWLMERLARWADCTRFEPSERPALEQALAVLDRLGRYCRDAFPSGGPDLSSLERILRAQTERLAAAIPPGSAARPEANPGPGHGQPTEVTGARIESSPGTDRGTNDAVGARGVQSQFLSGFDLAVELTDARQVSNALRQLQQASRTLAEAMLRLNVADPRPYDMLRAMTWVSIQVLPQADQGKTALRAPPLERRQLFRSLFEQAQYVQMILEVERSFVNAPFWLDAHYWVWRALDELKASAAQAAVSRHLAGFLSRFPELLEYRFDDDTPFASVETQAWWQSQRSASESSDAGIAVRESHDHMGWDLVQEPGDDQGETVFKEAHELARKNQLALALQRLQSYSQAAGREAQRFRRQLQLAEFCLQYRQKDLARAWLESLYRRLHEMSFWDWEPTLCSRVLERLLELEPVQAPDNPRWREYFDRLTVLDPVKAFRARQAPRP